MTKLGGKGQLLPASGADRVKNISEGKEKKMTERKSVATLQSTCTLHLHAKVSPPFFFVFSSTVVAVVVVVPPIVFRVASARSIKFFFVKLS